MSEVESPAVTLSVDEGVAWITLNKPDSGNALTAAMREQLVAWLNEASVDLAIRAVVIRGTGTKGFCTGADLRNGTSSVTTRPDDAPERAVGDVSRMIASGWQRLITAILDCEKPVLASVNAMAAGGGMHLALACDLVVASTDAAFCEVFIKRGIAPDAGGAWLLTRLVGIQRAKELFFFGDTVPAARALALGLVNCVVAPDELEETTAAWAARLAGAPTRAISITKALTNRALDVDRATSLNEEAMGQELITGTADMREGIAAFVERRPANFRGW